MPAPALAGTATACTGAIASRRHTGQDAASPEADASHRRSARAAACTASCSEEAASACSKAASSALWLLAAGCPDARWTRRDVLRLLTALPCAIEITQTKTGEVRVLCVTRAAPSLQSLQSSAAHVLLEAHVPAADPARLLPNLAKVDPRRCARCAQRAGQLWPPNAAI